MKTFRQRERAIRTATFLAALSLLSLSACSHGDERNSIGDHNIYVGFVADSPGFADGNPGNPEGFDVDLARWVVHDLGDDKKFNAVNLATVDARDTAVKSGSEALVVAVYSITTARNEAGIDFAGPYMKSGQAMMTKTGKMPSRAAFRNQRICAVAGTTGARTMQDQSNKGEVNLKATPPSMRDCITALKNGSVDAIFDDAMVLYGYASNPRNHFEVAYESEWGDTQLYGIGMLGNHQDECKHVNEAIENYLAVQWRTDFLSHFPGVPDQLVDRHRPSQTEIESRSCQVDDESD
jgi:glutamate transport system substrate-binding protein